MKNINPLEIILYVLLALMLVVAFAPLYTTIDPIVQRVKCK
jgi:predicted membrane channel-forming protein YqfA (hemolysin III family)